MTVQASSVSINTTKIRNMLRMLIFQMGNLNPVMADIADDMARSVQDNFLAGGRPAWPGLKATTIAQRIKKGKWPGQILVRSGQLQNSCHAFHGNDYAGVGTNKIYATTQQFGANQGDFGSTMHGSPIPWGDIPARPFLDIPEQDVDRIVKTISAWIMKGGK